MAQQAKLLLSESDGGIQASFLGTWTTRSLGPMSAELSALSGQTLKSIVFDLSATWPLDSAGAWVIHRTRRDLEATGAEVILAGANPAATQLLEAAARHDRPPPPKPPRANSFVAVLERLGRGTIEAAREARDLTSFLGQTVVVLLRSFIQPRRIRFTALVAQMEQTGLNALPIVGLISFLVGLVLAYQGADQLSRFGAQVFTVNLVAIGVLREMGILLTAIIVAGRSGSAFTAQIGTMKVNEEIDAMRTIGLDPMEVLVLPRVLGLILVMPLLTFYADIMGLMGGAVMVIFSLDFSLTQFLRQLSEATKLQDFWVGMIKAPLFAAIIAIVGCFEGLRVSRSAESVGRQTTRAVVEAIFLVIVLDALLSIFFTTIGF